MSGDPKASRENYRPWNGPLRANHRPNVLCRVVAGDRLRAECTDEMGRLPPSVDARVRRRAASQPDTLHHLASIVVSGIVGVRRVIAHVVRLFLNG